jgi:hypothetical protein
MLLFCCSPKQPKKQSEGKSEPKKIDLFEYFPLDKTDSLQLVQYWKEFLSSDFIQENTSLDTVVCWSAEDYPKVSSGDSNTMLVDACLAKYLSPLRKNPIWPVLHSNNFDVAKYKLQSETEYKFGISFPRRPNWTEHFFTYTFYFVRANNRLKFQGYTYN